MILDEGIDTQVLPSDCGGLSLFGHYKASCVSPDAEAGLSAVAFTVFVGSHGGSASGHCNLPLLSVSNGASGDTGPSGLLFAGSAAISCRTTVGGCELSPAVCVTLSSRVRICPFVNVFLVPV